MDLFLPEIGVVIWQLLMFAALVAIVVFFVRYFRRKNSILKTKEQELKASKK
ncbi:hypothetical protein VRU48_13365 [Pedobacter sp. KR3-3]|uniref:Uncharacterized protein n=1 Tax=Pedobacter albus TaxID=3113905 RepID=A0ABU7I9H4_9SPHI|nr:hypothetical protein [Pedobacter sp. KR3-3]MEE1946105.1 hypothetical protein [Pedobacter sp. KR3-3]